jgi:hypothetical protein
MRQSFATQTALFAPHEVFDHPALSALDDVEELIDWSRNVEIGVTRGRVEAIFGHMKRHWGMARSRFVGLWRTRTQFLLAAIGWNLWKGSGFRKRYG